jgi:predicted ArsR family transcriptional regulator
VSDLRDQLSSVGVLAEPARRALYEYVLRQPGPVGREQAAEAVGLPLHSVKFHLDKLAAAGLLEVEYRRLTGRTGPGAGRPSKLYRPSGREVAFTVPPRRYHLAGEVLAEAVDRVMRDKVPVRDAVQEVAREVGRELGSAVQADGDGLPPGSGDGAADLARTAAVLEGHGYQPSQVDFELCLLNCPFDKLAADHTELVCGLNLALVEGVLDALEAETVSARLAPSPGHCCVRVGPPAP